MLAQDYAGEYVAYHLRPPEAPEDAGDDAGDGHENRKVLEERAFAHGVGHVGDDAGGRESGQALEAFAHGADPVRASSSACRPPRGRSRVS